ncbi:MAG: ATP-binding protein [Ktedonobacteraceae bacterium]
MALTPQARAHVDAFKAVRVEHARLLEADRALTNVMEEHADAAHVLFYGPSGVGKSLVAHHTTAHFDARSSPYPPSRPTIWIEARPSDTGTYVRADYYRQVLSAVKGHIFVKEILVDIQHLMTASKPTRIARFSTDWLDLRQAVEQALIALQIQAIVVDEAHLLMQGDGHDKPEEQLEWLKSMSNRTNVLHVLVGPYELFKYRNTYGQVARRGRDIHFQRYHVEHKTERAEFVGALKYLLERVPLSCDLADLLKRWRWFAEGCVGCVGILKTWLVDAVAVTFLEGGTVLTVDALTQTMLHPAQRVRLELDARVGEHQVKTANAESQEQLQVLLGMKGKQGNGQVPREGVKGEDPSHISQRKTLPVSSELPQITPKPEKHRVGERTNVRDPTGDTLLTEASSATGCSFSEVLPLLPSAMGEAEVSHVECPVCLAVRALPSSGNTVKFPSHPKRVTRTPNRVRRWIRQGSTWELSG